MSQETGLSALCAKEPPFEGESLKDGDPASSWAGLALLAEEATKEPGNNEDGKQNPSKKRKRVSPIFSQIDYRLNSGINCCSAAINLVQSGKIMLEAWKEVPPKSFQRCQDDFLFLGQELTVISVFMADLLSTVLGDASKPKIFRDKEYSSTENIMDSSFWKNTKKMCREKKAGGPGFPGNQERMFAQVSPEVQCFPPI